MAGMATGGGSAASARRHEKPEVHRRNLVTFEFVEVLLLFLASTKILWNVALRLTCIGDTVVRGSVGQLLPAAVGAVLDAAVCTLYC